jgi:hypothetical protein
MDCSHTDYHWIEEVIVDVYGDEDVVRTRIPYDTFEDIDLHRYKCTQCGEVMWYSPPERAASWVKTAGYAEAYGKSKTNG